MQERRKYVRLNIPLEVSYTIQGERKGTRYKSITKNISPNGVRFALDKELPAGTLLDIDIIIPTQVKSIPVKIKIIWVKKETEQGKGMYDAGFEFVYIPEESKKEFFQYLCNQMYNQLKNF